MVKKIAADAKVLDLLRRCLTTFFDKEDITKLTFVCLPASSATVNQRRYAKFSADLCSKLGMSNGFGHITVFEDGEAKHTGGVKQVQVSYDDSFFSNKYILLFDDIITQGNTMMHYRRELECRGGHVICGFAIGKTVHTEREGDSIDEIDKYIYHE